MSQPLARDQHGNLFTVGEDGQTWRPLSDDEYGALRPKRVLDEMGVTTGERLTIKNLATNPASALAFLRHRGYEALQYGDGLNFAVRKSPEEAWRVVDPQKQGIGETFRDLSDLLGDVAVGAATIGGGVLGAATGGAAEFGREAIGEAVGLEHNISPGQIAGSALGGAIAGPLVKAAGGALRGAARGVAKGLREGGVVARFGEQVAQRIGGIKPGQNLEVADIITEAAARLPRPALRPIDVVDIARAHMDQVAGPTIGRLTKLRDAAIPAGATVDIERFAPRLAKITDVLNPRTLDEGKAALQEQAAALLTPPSRSAVAAELGSEASDEAIHKAYALAQATWRTELRSVPAPIALRLKKVMQTFASSRGAFAAVGAESPGAVAPATQEFTRDIGRFAGEFSGAIRSQLPKRVGAIDDRLSQIISARNGLRDLIGGADNNAAEKIITRAYERGNEQLQRTFSLYDRAFAGTSFSKLAASTVRGPNRIPGGVLAASREAAIGQRFTPSGGAAEFGLPSVFPRLGSTGTPLGASVVGGALGFAGGGPVGAVAGTLGGLIAASPAFIVHAGAGTTAAAAAVRRAAATAASTQSPAALRDLIQAATRVGAEGTGRMVLGQDTKKAKKKAYFTGG